MSSRRTPPAAAASTTAAVPRTLTAFEIGAALGGSPDMRETGGVDDDVSAPASDSERLDRPGRR